MRVACGAPWLHAVARSWRDRLVAAAITAAAVLVLLYFPDMDDGSGSLLGAISALFGVAVGLAAIDGLRIFPARDAHARMRLAAQALASGAVLGLLNLGINYGMAAQDPLIHAQMVARWGEFSAWSVVLAEPVLEEIIFRLLLMSAIGWIAARFTGNRRIIFAVALGVSSALFGVAHVFYGGVDAPLYQLGIALKTGALALWLGWIFWRWGLPYAMLAHCTANAAHLLLWPIVF